MRTFEIYLVFILFAMILSACSGYDKEIFRTQLLELNNKDRASKKLPELHLIDVSNSLYVSGLKNNEGKYINKRYCYKYEFCYIMVMLEENVSQMSAENVFHALMNVRGNPENEKKIENMIGQATVVDYILFETDEKKKNWYLAVYYPADDLNVTFTEVDNENIK